MDKRVGNYSFIAGVIIAVILGVVSLGANIDPWLSSIMIVLGLIVGLLNVAGKDTKDFLIVVAVLIIASELGGAGGTLASVNLIGPFLKGIFTQVLAFVVPATVIVCLKSVWDLTQKH